MKIAYYPGCTLKTKAKGQETSALASLDALGIKVRELERWNCCGALFSLSDDDLIHHIAPVRNLIRAFENDCDTIVTLCSQCYNTLKRANKLMLEDEEKRETINLFMDEEPDYKGEVKVVHLLTLLDEQVGFDKIAEKVVSPLSDLKIAPFYGCNLVRPDSASIEGSHKNILEQFLKALGAEVVNYSHSRSCCGSYQGIALADMKTDPARNVTKSAQDAGAQAIALCCPMCEYNLGTKDKSENALPTYYFTQLLAVALGLNPEVCQFELSKKNARGLLKDKNLVA